MPLLLGSADSPMPKWLGKPRGTTAARAVRGLQGLMRLWTAQANSTAAMSKVVCIGVVRIVPVSPLFAHPRRERGVVVLIHTSNRDCCNKQTISCSTMDDRR